MTVEFDAQEIAEQLRTSPDFMAWPDRIELVKQVIARISAEGASTGLLDALSLLAEDTKWEVRKEVADSLLQIPEEQFARFVSLLVDDSNSLALAI